MGQKHARKARRIIRGFQQQEPMFQGTDELHEKKLQRELEKMAREDFRLKGRITVSRQMVDSYPEMFDKNDNIEIV